LGVVFLAAISVHRFSTFRRRRREAGTLDERPEIIEGDPAVDLDQCPLDDLLKLG
jgi:hypothetical protein